MKFAMEGKKELFAGILTFLAGIALVTMNGAHLLKSENQGVGLQQLQRKLSFFDPKTVQPKTLHSLGHKNPYAGQNTTNAPIPKVLHHVVLGESPPPSMLKLVEWNPNKLHHHRGFRKKNMKGC